MAFMSVSRDGALTVIEKSTSHPVQPEEVEFSDALIKESEIPQGVVRFR